MHRVRVHTCTWRVFAHRCFNTCEASFSYLQGFSLAVEQLGDVPCHSLHQIPGVVSLDLKLALLLIINLQREKHEESKVGLLESFE